MTETQLHQQLEQLHKDSYGWALRCCIGNVIEAEDVLQTVYLKILEGKAKYKEKSSFKTWLFSVIRFTAIDAHRRQKVQRDQLEVVKNEISRDQYVETEIQEERDLQQFRKALDELSSRQKEVLQLVFYHDCSIQEASEIMRVSIGSARKHYQRGKDALRKKLKNLSLIKM